MVDEDLLLPHLLDGVVVVALHRVVVLVRKNIYKFAKKYYICAIFTWLISIPRRPHVVKLSGWGRWPRPWCCMACNNNINYNNNNNNNNNKNNIYYMKEVMLCPLS